MGKMNFDFENGMGMNEQSVWVRLLIAGLLGFIGVVLFAFRYVLLIGLTIIVNIWFPLGIYDHTIASGTSGIEFLLYKEVLILALGSMVVQYWIHKPYRTIWDRIIYTITTLRSYDEDGIGDDDTLFGLPGGPLGRSGSSGLPGVSNGDMATFQGLPPEFKKGMIGMQRVLEDKSKRHVWHEPFSVNTTRVVTVNETINEEEGEYGEEEIGHQVEIQDNPNSLLPWQEPITNMESDICNVMYMMGIGYIVQVESERTESGADRGHRVQYMAFGHSHREKERAIELYEAIKNGDEELPQDTEFLDDSDGSNGPREFVSVSLFELYEDSPEIPYPDPNSYETLEQTMEPLVPAKEMVESGEIEFEEFNVEGNEIGIPTLLMADRIRGTGTRSTAKPKTTRKPATRKPKKTTAKSSKVTKKGKSNGKSTGATAKSAGTARTGTESKTK